MTTVCWRTVKILIHEYLYPCGMVLFQRTKSEGETS
jgi:hypothetical protein